MDCTHRKVSGHAARNIGKVPYVSAAADAAVRG